MSLNEETYWKVQDYLDGKLNKNDFSEFEDLVSKDAGLQAEVELLKLADTLILRNRLLSASKVSEEIINNTKKEIFVKKIIIAGAIALVSAGIGAFVIYQKEDIRQHHPVAVLKKETAQQKEIKLSVSGKIKTEPARVTLPKSGKVTVQAELPALLSETLNVQKIITEEPVAISDTKDHVLSDQKPAKKEHLPEIKSLPAADKCDKVAITSIISVKNSCNNEDNGHIYIRDAEGGTGPYHYRIEHEKDHQEALKHQLKSGSYRIVITDLDNCSKTYQNITVGEINCIEIEKSFNPSLGEILELGVTETEGTLTVYSKDGKVIYSKDFHSRENLQWNGISGSGENLAGYYIYTIKYKDGSSKQSEVTITR